MIVCYTLSLLSILLNFIFRNKNLYLVIITLMFVFFSGFRGMEVGTDTIGYARDFYSVANIQIEKIFDSPYRFEPGFTLLCNIALYIFDDVQGLFFLYAIFTWTLMGYFVYINISKKYYWLAMFSIVAFGFYGYSMNVMRQALAIAIACNSIQYIVSRKYIKALTLIGISTLFHYSLGIMFPVVLFVILLHYRVIEGQTRLIYIFGVICVLVIFISASLFIFISSNLDMFFGSYVGYFSPDSRFNAEVGLSGRLIAQSIFYISLALISCSYYTEGEQRIRILLYSIFMLIAAMAAFSQMGVMKIFYRIVDTFNVYICVLLPEIFNMEKRFDIRAWGIVIVVIIGFLQLHYNLVNGINEVTDYSLC